jgi:hypothetical protein
MVDAFCRGGKCRHSAIRVFGSGKNRTHSLEIRRWRKPCDGNQINERKNLMPELSLHSVSTIVVIGGKEFPFTAEVELSTSGGSGGDPAPPEHIEWQFHKSYRDAFPFPSVETILIQLGQWAQLATGRNLFTEWKDMLEDRLTKVPVVGVAANKVLNVLEDVRIRITDIVVKLDKVTENGTENYQGKFLIGFMLDFDDTDRPKFFGVELEAFGATFGLESTLPLDQWKLN